jgi:amino acid transporter
VTLSPQIKTTSIPKKGRRFTLSWRSAFVLSLGGILLVTVSLGPMAGEIGVASLIAWGTTALIGLFLCLFLAELSTRYPYKVGGAPAYIHEGFKHISPLFGALATWSYWVAWIPGVAVNLTLAATYLQASFFPHINIFPLIIILLICLYTLNYFGLRASTPISILIALCALVPLSLILIAPLFRPGLWHPEHFLPLFPDHTSWHSWPLLCKWMFVAAWSSYGAEMIATIVGELHNPQKEGARAITLAAIAGVFSFTVVPTVLIALVGVQGLTQDPAVVFLTAATDIFGPFGSAIISIMLIAALLLGAELFVISSSRALYQMSLDGLTLRGYGKVNRYGVPVGSMFWDALVTLLLLVVFRGAIVNVVAAANVGYLIVFILLPIAYIFIKKRSALQNSGIFHLPNVFIPIALGITLFNTVLLVIGGMQWGYLVMGVGFLLILAFIPFYLLRKKT